ncbi:MAG: hypothetical protein M3463_03320 [Verrucomicrobiota bacterium]|nr:hypothetical protein [Verrucomicrobiota bacterium]
MKTFKTLLPALLLTAALAGCEKPATNGPTAENYGEPKKAGDDAGAGDAVQLKEGHGLSLHPKIRQSIGLEVADVSEAQVASEFTADLHVIQGAGGFQRVAFSPGAGGIEANGWLTSDKAARLKPGQELGLRVDGPAGSATEKGVVKRLEKSPYATLGDFEVVVETAAPFDTGTRLLAMFQSPAGDAVPAVPRSALLRTVEGWFVYAVNESFFLRTPVKVGAMNGELAEITDGLYAGDQIVVSPVNTLWMAELQILRGGKSCTCGH